ncbi:hypothetical protein [Fluviibacterium sp. S390]|uniref:hypothetical protein n=1 Tax=Fluviibacterium sp. S390 TaxID=3415139 RepID=UPI003C7C9356
MFKRLITAALIFGAAATAPPVHAQSPTACAPREVIARTLEKTYGEHLSAAGLQSETQLLEVWNDPVSGSWTIVVTEANGRACIVASGQHWHAIMRAMVPPGEPS